MSKVFIKIYCLFLFVFLSFPLLSQDTEDYEYTREFIWGINKNTNGGLIGGIVFKYSQALKPTLFQSYGIELVNVKHPKEVRRHTYNGNSYIHAKENYLYSVRLQYGREKILFKKAPQQGVQVTGILAAGPTIGVVAPYYIQVYVDNFTTITVPNKPNQNQGDIAGTGGIFQGIEDSKIKLGANIKASVSFEFGTFKNSVTGFEAGFLLEAFPEEIMIIPGAKNNKIFTSAFLTILFGTRR